MSGAVHACLDPGDGPAFVTHRPSASAHALIVCDHASAGIPARLNRLGLSEERLGEHIAYDIGASRLAIALSERLDTAAVLSCFSRLVVDLNRFPDNPASIPEFSDGVRVPGNAGLDAEMREARYRDVFWPYHRAVAARLDRLCAIAPDPLVIAVHTFTPRMSGGEARPWHVGVLSNEDRRVADPLIEALSGETGLCVGDNEPYSAMEPLGYSMVTHCQDRELPHALLEVRQDLVSDEGGVALWAEILERALRHPDIFPRYAEPAG